MTQGSRPDPSPGTLDLPIFSDGDESLILPATDVPPGQPWWRRRWVMASIAAALLVVLGVSVAGAVALSRRPHLALRYQRASQGNLELAINATGQVQSGVYTITYTGTAKIASIAVKVGDSVAAGEVVAALDTTSLQDAVNQAQASVDSAQTALDNAQDNADQVAAQTQADLQAAYDQEQLAIQTCNTPAPTTTATPVVTPTPPNTSGCIQHAKDQYASARAQASQQNATARAQVSAAQAQLNTAEARLQTAQDNLDGAILTAPHGGTVSQVNGNVGETPGANFIQIVDLSALQIAANVNEADIGAVAVGNAAHFTVSAYGTRQFQGTVGAISPVGQGISNVVSFLVTIDVDGQSAPGAHLFPGMTASVTIITAQRFQVVLIPAQAIAFARTATEATAGSFITPAQARQATEQAQQMLTQLENSGTDVTQDNPTPAYVLARAKDRWVVRPVVLGLTNGTSYEVLAGLASGDTIVVGAQRA